jgi:hypothetical protein
MRTFDLPPKVARRVGTVTPGRRARINLDHVTPRKAFDTTGDVDRESKSAPPPTHEPGFAEYRCNPFPVKLTGRQFRLWSHKELK